MEENEEIEERIEMEIVVDAYGSEERAMGWYYYVADNCEFPFKAKCIAERRTSPLSVGEEVEVLGVPPTDDCDHEIHVDIPWKGRELAVPLSQLEGIDVDEETQQVIDDWHYWCEQGYEF